MKLSAHFNDFLRDTVNLNQSRINLLGSRVDTIKKFLRASDYEPKIKTFAAQGSWAHKTIIKPPSGDKEFDADLVMYINPVEGWEAANYITKLREVFKSSSTYKNITSMKSRCVTLDYSGDFHLDVVPVVVEENFFSADTYEVCNRADNCFEASDGDGFKEWWAECNSEVGNNNLIKATRLLKYLRDTKATFSVKSVLLTTLLGQRVEAHAGYLFSTDYPDLPTTLKLVVEYLDDWLRENPTLPKVQNPALPQESFTRNWTQEQYENFCKKISQYRSWIDEAYDEEDRDESIRKWRRLFGDAFAKGAVQKAHNEGRQIFDEAIKQGRDLVSLVETNGRGILNYMPYDFPHILPVPYGESHSQIPIRIVAHERVGADEEDLRQLTSGDNVRPHSGIQFRAVQAASGAPFSNDFRVEWQVVNTDAEATKNKCLRGGFYPSERQHSRYEPTLYRGVHWVQAFLINKRTGLVNGKSGRFFVQIA